MFPNSKYCDGRTAFRFGCIVLILGLVNLRGEVAKVFTETDSLTLEEALTRTLERNPNLAAHHLEIKARESRILQAGRISNPVLSLETENFAGSGNLSGVDGLETTVRVGQTLELGGKRASRIRLAGSEMDLAQWDLKATRATLEAEVRSAFTDVLAAQERLRILEEGLSVDQQILETAKLRHNAGKAPATEEMKAKMAYSLNHIEIDRAGQDLRSARTRLASFWSTEPPGFKGAKGDLRGIPSLPSLESLIPKLDSHPDLARWKTEVAQRRYSGEAARADRMPDVSVEAGVRQIRDGDQGDVAFVAGVSMPIPLLNRNQGTIREAGHRLAKAGKEQQVVAGRLSARLRTLHETLQARSEEIAHLKDELLPESAKTLQASREAYRMGKLSFLEVLDSQRTLYELSNRFISTLADYHRDWNELVSLVAAGDMKNP